MRFDILTIFPKIFDSYFSESILKRAQAKGLIKIAAHNVRDFTTDKYHKVDDVPYGGGAGMVMKAEPIVRAVAHIVRKTKARRRKIMILSAKGKQFNQRMAYDWAKRYDHIVLVSGRYEGIDERVKAILRAEEISMGPYVLTDGDVAAMAIVSAVARLIPGVIRFESLAEESHWNLLLKKEVSAAGKGVEHPHYTRPAVFAWKGKKYRVPKILATGDHERIAEWRRRKSG